MSYPIRFRPRRFSRLAGFAAGVAALALAGSLHAQFGQAAGFQDAMVPDIMHRDLQIFDDALELDDSQRIILEQFFEDYQTAFNAGTQQMIETFQGMVGDLQSGDKRMIMQIVFQPIRDWIITKRQYRDQFFRDVQEIVIGHNTQQLDLWPGFERRLRREQQMKKGRLSGERVNLLHVLRQMDLEPIYIDPIRPTLLEYELALDEALRLRISVHEQNVDRGIKAIQNDDPDLSLSMVEDVIATQTRVRDTNDMYVERIAEVLGSPLGDTFRQNALEAGYPRIFRTTPVGRLFAAALEIADLDANIAAAIADMQQTYLAELMTANAGLMQLTRSLEPVQERERAEEAIARVQGQRVVRKADELRAAFRERDRSGETYIESLRGMLTEEQFASLPGASRYTRRTMGQPRELTQEERIRLKSGSGTSEETGGDDTGRKSQDPTRGGGRGDRTGGGENRGGG